MKTAEKRVKNFQFDVQFVALAILIKRDYTWSVLPLNIRSNWLSLEGLNAPNGQRRTKNRKLYKFLRANSTKAKREKLMEKVRVLFD
jgi:hypothetical protein